MTVLSTGPVENHPVGGVRPSQQVRVKIINGDSDNSSEVLVQGYYLNGSRSLYVLESLSLIPGEVLTRNYFTDLDAFQFVFTTSGLAEPSTDISFWGTDTSGQLVTAHRFVSDELLGSGVPGPQGEEGPQGIQGPQGPQGIQGPPTLIDTRRVIDNSVLAIPGGDGNLITFNLPEITLTSNKTIELTAFCRMDYISDAIANFYSYVGVVSLVEPALGTLVQAVFGEEIFKRNTDSKQTVISPSVSYLLPNLDPGTYNFSLNISTGGEQIESRVLYVRYIYAKVFDQ